MKRNEYENPKQNEFNRIEMQPRKTEMNTFNQISYWYELTRFATEMENCGKSDLSVCGRREILEIDRAHLAPTNKYEIIWWSDTNTLLPSTWTFTSENIKKIHILGLLLLCSARLIFDHLKPKAYLYCSPLIITQIKFPPFHAIRVDAILFRMLDNIEIQ